MYLKSDKELYKTRQFRLGHWIMVFLMIGAGIYVGYQVAGFINNESPVSIVAPTAIPTSTPSPAYFIDKAEGAYWEGHLTDAVYAYYQALALEPNQAQVYVANARLLILSGQAERGLEMAREALKRQPQSAFAWAVLGLAYDWLGLPEQAVAYCEKAVELDPTLPEAYAYLAEAYIDSGLWYAANDTIATALELDARNVDVMRAEGYVLENQGNYSGAIQTYRRALALHDKLSYLHLAVGRNASVLGNYTMALEAYSAAAESDPQSAVAYDQQGWMELLLGEYDKAKINLNRAVELDPFLGDAYGHLGTLYFQQVNYEDAIAYLGPAITYGEAFSRRRTVLFIITLEASGQVGNQPAGTDFAYVEFIHPYDATLPLRGGFMDSSDGSALRGTIRLDVTSGRYTLSLDDIPPAPSGSTYIGWFTPLYTPEGNLVHTEPLFPTPNGKLEVEGFTGHVKSQ
ncbi:MAG: tetratricopeptide repeat protein, partial [Anaerolineae bacterium]|nr:tetratricopeptide repeat protein [Anaerolineae bacterium]